MGKRHTPELTGEYKKVYDNIHEDRVTLISIKEKAEGIQTKDKKVTAFLAELTVDLEAIIDIAENSGLIIEELSIERAGEAIDASDARDQLDSFIDPDHYGIGDEYHTKLAIAQDLMENCSVEEMEALEMLMRIKKGGYYRESRAGFPHPDNVNIDLCFSEKLNDYLVQDLL